MKYCLDEAIKSTKALWASSAGDASHKADRVSDHSKQDVSSLRNTVNRRVTNVANHAMPFLNRLCWWTIYLRFYSLCVVGQELENLVQLDCLNACPAYSLRFGQEPFLKELKDVVFEVVLDRFQNSVLSWEWNRSLGSSQ
jgi:hypothetical protein